MPETAWLAIAYAASFPLLSLRKTSAAILASWRRFRWLAGFQILNQATTLIVVLGLLLAGFGVPGMVLGTAIGHVTNGLMMMGAATYVLDREVGCSWWKASLDNVTPLRKELTIFFGWNYLMLTLSGIMEQVPLILLGRFRGPKEAGFYSLATTFVTVGSYMGSSLGQVAYPVLSARWGAGERGSLNRTLKHWTLQGGFPVCLLMLLSVPLLPIVIPIAFSPAYNPMVLGTQVMTAAAAVSAVFFWLNSFYYASGRIGLWTKAYSLYTVFVVGLAWFCTQRWGFSGLASLVALGKVLFTVSMAVVFVIARERFQ